MRGYIEILVILGFAVFSCVMLNAQTRQQLEKQRLDIIKEIEKSSKQLETTKKDKEKNLTILRTLDQQMQSRKKLIENLKSELTASEKTISENTERINILSQKYQSLKDQYSVILRASYLRKMTNSKWSYLLSSENLNNLLIRWRYLHQFDQYVQSKLAEITSISNDITAKNEEIEKSKEVSQMAIEESSKNMTILEKEQKEKDQLIKKLSKEELSLSNTIKKREREREELNTAIERVIVAELAKSREKEKNDVKAVSKNNIDNTSFAKNKGSLSYPITNAKITSRFGTHPHPTIKNIQVSNNGVDFTLPKSDNVTCVFDGEIVGITNIPGFKNMVIIKHGSYYTVYSKLDETSVTKGQKIKRGQSIGRVIKGEDDNAELHFELWQDKIKLDPEKWFR